MEKISKSEKGITLIALVVTIIVLLILAGVTIASIVKDNGIINKANLAKKETTSSQKGEENDLTCADKIIEETVDDREIPIVLVITSDENDNVVIPVKEECLVDWNYQWENNPNYEGNFVNEGVKNNERITHCYNGNPFRKHTIAIKGNVTALSIADGVYYKTSKLDEILSWGTTGLKMIDLRNTDVTKIASPNIRSFDKLENCQYAFLFCSSLKSIPSNFFANCPNLITLESAFRGCDALEEVPQNLVVNCPNLTNLKTMFEFCDKLKVVSKNFVVDSPNIENVDGIFSFCGALEIIPEDLFKGMSKVTKFNECFSKCTSLKSIPKGLFKEGTNVTEFIGTFMGCSSLSMIPEELFNNCVNAEIFDNTFKDCKSLETIPEKLFANCTKARKFSDTFRYCTVLSAIPEKLFDKCKNVQSYYGTFAYDRGLKGNCPELWNSVNVDGTKPRGAACFNYCENLSNYAIIPEPWRNYEEEA